MNQPSVFIGILNYNKGKYLSQCIDSVLEQITTFSYTIHIVDDASTDNSLSVIDGYVRKNPEIIHVSFHDTNRGVLAATQNLLSHCKSKYFCVLDGDDYWCSNSKLEKQLLFLENHPDYVGCFHDAQIVTSIETDDAITNNRSLGRFALFSQCNFYKEDVYPEDLVKRIIIPTASLVFRYSNLNHIIKEQTDYLSLYWVLQLEIIKNSKFRYFNEVWSVYRDHSDGISKTHSLLRFKLRHIEWLKHLLSDPYYAKYKTAVYESIANEYRNLIWALKYEDSQGYQLNKFFREFWFYYSRAGKYQLKDLKKFLE